MTNSTNNQVNNTTSTATQGATMNYITKGLNPLRIGEGFEHK